MITRRQVLIAGAASALLGLDHYARQVEPFWLDVNFKALKLSRGEARAAPDAAGSNLRILHLSDLHYSNEFPLRDIITAIELGIAQRPDLICLTGDYVTTSMPNPAALKEALTRLTKQAQCFAVAGNHDGGWAETSGCYKSSEPLRSQRLSAPLRAPLWISLPHR